MISEFEYRYEDHGDQWVEFKGGVWDSEYVATTVAEEYWDNGDQGDANDFELIVEVRRIGTPDKIETFRVTADYSVNFYARLQKKETKCTSPTNS